MKKLIFVMMGGVAAMICSLTLHAKEIGSVDTKWNFMRPDDSVKIEMFKDPKIEGVTCYISRAEKGGYSGALGLAEDTSDASLDCRQTGPIKVTNAFKEGESVFRERRSLIFKSLKVIRFCDTENNALVYLVYSERVIEGSPKNSVTAVPIRPWGNNAKGSIEQCVYK